jgi:hypothetical protein
MDDYSDQEYLNLSYSDYDRSDRSDISDRSDRSDISDRSDSILSNLSNNSDLSIERNESENKSLEKRLFGDLSSDFSSNSSNSYIEKTNKKKLINDDDDGSIFEIPVFDDLYFDEKKYLPISYILSPNMEWYYIEKACKSNFNDVTNLSRVSNKTIKKIANISQYALDKKTCQNPTLNNNFIKYANQRGL